MHFITFKGVNNLLGSSFIGLIIKNLEIINKENYKDFLI